MDTHSRFATVEAKTTAQTPATGLKRFNDNKDDDGDKFTDKKDKEPLNPATVNSDPAWADAVRWVVYSLIQAEEMGITAANIDAKVAEAKANKNLAQLRRFFGVEGDLGKQLGLPADFVVRTVKAVGNYGEVYVMD